MPFLKVEMCSFLKLKSALFKVEKCPFSLKSALLFEKLRHFTGGLFWSLFTLKRPLFNVEKCPFLKLKSALFKVEKCPFSLKSTLLFEKKGSFTGGETIGLLR